MGGSWGVLEGPVGSPVVPRPLLGSSEASGLPEAAPRSLPGASRESSLEPPASLAEASREPPGSIPGASQRPPKGLLEASRGLPATRSHPLPSFHQLEQLCSLGSWKISFVIIVFAMPFAEDKRKSRGRRNGRSPLESSTNSINLLGAQEISKLSNLFKSIN